MTKSQRLASIIALLNRIYRRRRACGRPVHHLPRRAKWISDAYLAALSSERAAD